MYNAYHKLSPLDGFKDDKNAVLERGSVATCGLKTEGNNLSLRQFQLDFIQNG